MCNRNRDCIILIIKQYFFFYLHEGVEHPRDRFFVGAATSRSCTFHFARCVFENLDTCSLCGVNERAAHLCDPHCGLLIGLKVQLFHGQTIRRIRRDEPAALISNLREPVGEFRLRGRLDTSRIQKNFLPAAVFFHHSHAATSVSGVDSEHFHTKSIARSIMSISTTTLSPRPVRISLTTS